MYIVKLLMCFNMCMCNNLHSCFCMFVNVDMQCGTCKCIKILL